MMKRIFLSVSLVLASVSLFAQEAEVKAEESIPESKNIATVWPAWFAVCQWPRSLDVVGLRLTIPFSTSQENVTGIDLGFWGKSVYFEGLQLNLLRNNVIDGATGIQIGLYNSVGSGDFLGIQTGLWNEANTACGFQVGLVNVMGEGQGFQVGLINRAETLYGYQVGLVNIIRGSSVPFFPVINVGF